MLLKTKRAFDFKVLPDHTAQKLEKCTFLVLPLLFYFCAAMDAQYTHCTRMSAFVSLTYEHASYGLTLAFVGIPLTCVLWTVECVVLVVRHGS